MTDKKSGAIATEKRLRLLAQSAVIAALYVGLTYAVSALSYGSVQFRLSEALTLLPVIMPAAIPGLTIGCLIGNLGSPYGIMDIVLGTLASLLAAICARAARKIRVKGLPLFSAFMPVFFNAVIIGAEITLFLPEGATLLGFLLNAGSIALGEAGVCLALGLPLCVVLERRLPGEWIS